MVGGERERWLMLRERYGILGRILYQMARKNVVQHLRWLGLIET